MRYGRDYLNIGILALCEAIFMASALVNVAIAGLASQGLVANETYATLPQAMIPVVSMAVTIPASYAMKFIGRRNGFLIGVLAAIASGLLCAYALYVSSFALFFAGVALLGVYQAFATYYRFAVADQADESIRGKAVSLVLAGGMLAAFIGPNVASHTRELFAPITFLGSYAAIVAMNLVALLLLPFLKLSRPATQSVRRVSFDPGVVLQDPKILVAMLFCGLGNSMMMLVMTATPLAMLGCGFGVESSSAVIGWHVVAMFLPFFFSGSLIRRFGLYPLMLTGLALGVISGLIAMAGLTHTHFAASLIISGLAWNFMYVGGSTLLAGAGDDETRPLIQGMNEFLTFAMTATGAFASGAIFFSYGWHVLNAVAVGATLLLFLVSSSLRQRVFQAP